MKRMVETKYNQKKLEFGLISCVHGYVVNLQIPELKRDITTATNFLEGS